MAFKSAEVQQDIVIPLDISNGQLLGLAGDAVVNFPKEHPRVTGAVLGLGIPFALHGVAHAQDGGGESSATTNPEQEVAMWGLIGMNAAAILGFGGRAAWRVQGTLRAIDQNIDDAVIHANKLEQATPDDFAKTYELLLKLGKIQHGVSKEEFIDGQVAHKDENMQKADKAIHDLQWVRRWKAVTGYGIVVPAEAAQGFFAVNGALLIAYYAKDILKDYTMATNLAFKAWLIAGGAGMLYVGRTISKDLMAVGSVGGLVEARANEATRTLEALGMIPKEQRPQRPKRATPSVIERILSWATKGSEPSETPRAQTARGGSSPRERVSRVKIR